MQAQREKLWGGLVWVATGLFLLLYGILGLTHSNIPGIADLVLFIQTAQGGWVYLAAFLSIFLEGLYFIGSFFPGSTLVLIIAILSQAAGIYFFATITLVIYLGWIAAGIVNILGAKLLFAGKQPDATTQIRDDAGITWFPAFRANTEVAQILTGHSPYKVFFSSLRVKTIACLGLGLYAFVIPFFVDVTNLSNKEGFTSVAIIALINFCVGGYKLWEYFKK